MGDREEQNQSIDLSEDKFFRAYLIQILDQIKINHYLLAKSNVFSAISNNNIGLNLNQILQKTEQVMESFNSKTIVKSEEENAEQ